MIPAGTVPSVHVTTPLLFAAWNETSFDAPTSRLSDAGDDDTVSSNAGVDVGDIASVNDFDTEFTPFDDVALTANVKLPASVGVPEIVPSVLRVSPLGSAPLSTAHVTVDGVALSV